MLVVKVGERKYVNMERVTYIEEMRGKIWIRFAVADGVGATSCELEGQEAQNLLRWLDSHSEKAAR